MEGESRWHVIIITIFTNNDVCTCLGKSANSLLRREGIGISMVGFIMPMINTAI